MTKYLQRLRNARKSDDRGAAVVEFALAIPIFLVLIAFVFDAGLGYSTARASSAAARDAALVGARAGEDRLADYQVLDALRASYGTGEGVASIVVYISPPGADGTVPDGCVEASIQFVCNSYPGTILATLDRDAFTTSVDFEGNELCEAASPDAALCPLNRRTYEGSFLGVAIATRHDNTLVGPMGPSGYDLTDRSVFPIYFAPLPVPAGGDGGGGGGGFAGGDGGF